MCSALPEASSGQMAEGVSTNNQTGRRSGPPRFLGGLDKSRHIVRTLRSYAKTFGRKINRNSSSIHQLKNAA